MSRLRNLIIEVLQTPNKKDCNCGCGGCSSKRIGPILNENIVFSNPLSDNLKHYIDNNIPLNRRLSGMKTKEHNKVIVEARSLYSRLVLNVNNTKDKKILTENERVDYSEYYEAFQDQFKDILDKLDDIDTSIDFVAAGVTGKDPLDINIDQRTMGRFSGRTTKEGIVDKILTKESIQEIINEGWPTGLLSLLGLALMAWANKKDVSVETPSNEEFEFNQSDWNGADLQTKAELLDKLYKTAGSNVKNVDVKVKMTWEELVPIVGKELGEKIYNYNK